MNKNKFNFLKFNKLTGALTIIALSLLIVFSIGFLNKIISEKIISTIRKQCESYEINLNSIEIQKINFRKCTITDLTLGDKDKFVELPLIEIEYDFFDLIKKFQIKKILIKGLNFDLVYKNGKLSISGLNFDKFINNSNGKSHNKLKLPELFLENYLVNVHFNGEKTSFFGNLNIKPEKENKIKGFFNSDLIDTKFNGIFDKNFSGQILLNSNLKNTNKFVKLLKLNNISITGNNKFKSKINFLNGNVKRINLDIENCENKMVFNGFRIYWKLNGTANINENFKIEKLTLNGTTDNLFYFDRFNIKNIVFSIENKNNNSIKFKLNNGYSEIPYKFDFNISGIINNIFNNPTITGNVNLNIKNNKFAFNNNELRVNNKLSYKGNFNFDKNKNSFNCQLNSNQKLKGKFDYINFKTEKFIHNLKIKGNINKFSIFSKVSTLNSLFYNDELGKFTIKNSKIITNFNIDNLKVKNYKGNLNIFSLNFKDKDENQLNNLALNLPFNSLSKTSSGNLTIEKVSTSDIYFNNLTSDVNINNKSYQIDFKGLTTLPVPQLILNFKGNLNLNNEPVSKVKFKILETKLKENTDFSPLSDSFSNYFFSGIISLDGETSISSIYDIKAKCKLNLKTFYIKNNDESLKVNNLNATINFNDLLNFQSDKTQILTFDFAGNENINLKKGEVKFNIVDDSSFFIEKGKFQFCEGTIFTSAFLLTTDFADTSFDIYCQKISLPSLLNTCLGEKKAIGSGHLSGIIPISLKNEKIIFKKSFLHSVPGELGELKIENGKDITGGVILAEEAIKDFQYKFATIDFETVNENLNLILRLDGKPKGKLPLVYDDKLQDFRKTNNNEKHVELQGLKLDLKFVDIDINKLINEQSKLNFSSN